MIFSELTSEVAKAVPELTIAEVTDVLRAFSKVTVTELSRGVDSSVAIPGLGKFKIRENKRKQISFGDKVFTANNDTAVSFYPSKTLKTSMK